MGKLIDGRWSRRTWTRSDSGEFRRSQTVFRNRITVDGEHTPDEGRYHLYVSYACPWAHRTLMARALLGLQHAVSVSVVDPFMTDEGWHFSQRDGSSLDPVNGFTHLRDVYRLADSAVTCRVTVPVLWDKQARTIVNNESQEIVRMFDRVLAPAHGHQSPLTPPELQDEVDALTARFYNSVNNGVYRCGFATTQQAYEKAFQQLFAELDTLEAQLNGREWLVGGRLTEADLFLFATLYRFDAAYFGHFKCNLRAIRDYPNLQAHLERVHALPGVQETCRLDHIVEHYYRSHDSINPTRVIPKGPRDYFPVNQLSTLPLPVPGLAEPPAPSPTPSAPLDAEGLARALSTRPNWSIVDGALVRRLQFSDFTQAFGFLTRVAASAEHLAHHPDIENSYNRVTLRLRTHDDDAITDLDLALADAIDSLHP